MPAWVTHVLILLALLLIAVGIERLYAKYWQAQAVKGEIKRHDSLARCTRCGYPTRGVQSLACPECGADYRETGIMTAGMRGRSRFWPAFWLTLAMVAMSLTLFGPVASAWFPILHTYQEQVQFTGPPSLAYQSLEVSWHISRIHWPWEFGQTQQLAAPATLTLLDHQGGRHQLRVNPDNTRHTIIAPPNNAAGGPLDTAQLADWIVSRTNASPAAVQGEAYAVMERINWKLSENYTPQSGFTWSSHSNASGSGGGAFSGSNTSSSTHQRTSSLAIGIFALFMLAIWLHGIYCIFTRDTDARAP